MKTFMKLSWVVCLCAAGMNGMWAAGSGGGERPDAGYLPARLLLTRQASTKQTIVSGFDQHKLFEEKCRKEEEQRRQAAAQQASPTGSAAVAQVERPRTDGAKFPKWLKEADKGAYQRFMAGALVYLKGQPGEKVMPIKDVANPETLAGTFNISGCDDAGQYVVFNTGFRTCQNPANANKVEVWFAPRSLVELELNGSAKHLAPIFGNWPSTIEVGIFWTWGGWNHGEQAGWYDYLISQNGNDLSNNNLYEKWAGHGAARERAVLPAFVRGARERRLPPRSSLPYQTKNFTFSLQTNK